MRRARQTFLPPSRERWERRQVTGQRVHGPKPLELQEECLSGECVLHHVCAVQTVDAVGAEHARLCCSRRRVADLEEVPVCDGEWSKHVKQKVRGTTKEDDKPHLLVLVPEHRVHDRDLVVPVVPAVVVEVKVEVPHGGVVQQRDVATEHRRQCALLASGVDEIDDNHAAVLLHKRRKVVSEPKCLASRTHVVKASLKQRDGGAQTGSVVWAKTIRGDSLSRRCSQKSGTEPRTCTNDDTMPSWHCPEKGCFVKRLGGEGV